MGGGKEGVQFGSRQHACQLSSLVLILAQGTHHRVAAGERRRAGPERLLGTCNTNGSKELAPVWCRGIQEEWQRGDGTWQASTRAAPACPARSTHANATSQRHSMAGSSCCPGGTYARPCRARSRVRFVTLPQACMTHPAGRQTAPRQACTWQSSTPGGRGCANVCKEGAAPFVHCVLQDGAPMAGWALPFGHPRSGSSWRWCCKVRQGLYEGAETRRPGQPNTICSGRHALCQSCARAC